MSIKPENYNTIKYNSLKIHFDHLKEKCTMRGGGSSPESHLSHHCCKQIVLRRADEPNSIVQIPSQGTVDRLRCIPKENECCLKCGS